MTKQIIRPVVSEKSLADQAKGRYNLIVDRAANKNQIAKAVSRLFGVNVERVWTKKRAGQSKRVGRQRQFKRYADEKIAVVQLAEGQKIDILETKGK